MSDTFLVLECGATEMTQYEVPNVLKPVVEAWKERQRNLLVYGRQSGKTEMKRQWVDAAMKADPVAAALIKVTKVPKSTKGYEAKMVETSDYGISNEDAQRISNDVEESVGWVYDQAKESHD